MHLEIPQVPFAGCAVDTIGLLPMMSEGNKYMLTFMYLLTSYLIAASLKLKTAEEVTMAYIKHILPTTSCNTFILQDNGTDFKNSQLVATFKSLDIKPIYSNPYRPQGNSRLENACNFLKCTISKFLHNSTLELDYLGTEPGQLAVDKLKCMWRLHAELLCDSRETKDSVEEKKI